MTSSNEKWISITLSAVVAGLAFFGGYRFIANLGLATAKYSPQAKIAGTTPEALSDSDPLRFSDGSGKDEALPPSLIPLLSEEEKKDDTSAGPAGTSRDLPTDSFRETSNDHFSVVAADPLYHRQRVDGDFVDLLSTTPRSVVVRADRFTPSCVSDTLSAEPGTTPDCGWNIVNGSPFLPPVVFDLPGVEGEFSFEPLAISVTTESLGADSEAPSTPRLVQEVSAPIEATSLLPDAGSATRIPNVELGMTVPTNALPADRKAELPVNSPTVAPPPPVQRERSRPGSIYGQALGGSVSGLIGGMSAPPLDSGVNYRPVVNNGARGREEKGVPPGTIPAISPLMNAGVNQGDANGLVPQTGLALPSGIGVGISGLDLRVNTTINIR